MTTLPSTGPISFGNVQTVLGHTSFSTLRARHPLFSTTAGPVSLSNCYGIGGGLSGWYDAASFGTTVWIEKSGVGANASVTGNVITTTGLGVSCVSGGNTAMVTFPNAMTSNAKNYTLFHLTRMPVTQSTAGRIFTDSSNPNWLSGHWHGFSRMNTGICHHDTWLTPVPTSNYAWDHGTAWILSTDQWDLYRSNRIKRSVNGGTATPSGTLEVTINGLTGEKMNNWQCAEVIAFNRILSNAEIKLYETYLNNKYNLALPAGDL